MLKFYLWLHNFSDFEIYPLEILWEIVFGTISGYYLSLQLKKMEEVFNRFKIILVLGFCPQKTKITRSPIGFRLNTLPCAKN